MNSKDYIKYLPEISSNPHVNGVIYLMIPALLVTVATFGPLYFNKITIKNAIIFSVFFAILEYIVKVPAIKYCNEIAGMSYFIIQAIWIIMTLILAKLANMYFPNTI